MKLHRILKLYYGILMQIFIIKNSSSDENSNQMKLENFQFFNNNNNNNSKGIPQLHLFPTEENENNFNDYNICGNCTSYMPKRKFHKLFLKRRKRFIIFPQDGAIKFTLVLTKALIDKVPRGLGVFIEMDGFYPLPDTLDKWKPTRHPSEHVASIHHTNGMNHEKDPIPPPVPDDNKNDNDVSLKMSQLPSGDPLQTSNMDDDKTDGDSTDNNNDQMNLMDMTMMNGMNMNGMNMNGMDMNGMTDNETEHYTDHDHHPLFKNSYGSNDYNNLFSSYPFSMNSGSEKIYPTPPPGWVNNDNNENNKTIDLSSHYLKPPYLPQMDNDITTADNNNKDKDDENLKNFKKTTLIKKKIDAWTNWNRNKYYYPTTTTNNNYNQYQYQKFNQYPSYKFRQPINRYYDRRNQFNSYLPMKWNQQQQQQQRPQSKLNVFPWKKNNQNWNIRRQSRMIKNTIKSFHDNKDKENNSKEWYSHRGHRERRHVYNEIETYALKFGFVNMKYCIFRTMCEVRNYLLPRGVSLLHDIIRVIFTLPHYKGWSDEYVNEARSNKTDCKLQFLQTCPISILEFLLYSNRNNLKHNVKIV